MAQNFIPDKVKIGRYKYDSSVFFLTLKRRCGAYLFAGEFTRYTGYSPIDNPRDPIISFERDATDKVRTYDNTPIEGLKIGKSKEWRRSNCIQIIDPRGWKFYLQNYLFFNLISNGININNQTLSGQFVYSVIDDCNYNIVPVNSNEYNEAIKESEEKSRIKKLKAGKTSDLVVGKVYDYLYDKRNTCRAIYMGKLPRIVGWKFAKWHIHDKKFTDEKFNQERYVWLLLMDNIYQSRYISNCACRQARFNSHGSNRLVVTYDNSTNRIKRQYELLMLNPIRFPQHMDLFFFDDYIKDKFNFEFTMDNILVTSGIDKLAVLQLSQDQSYKITKVNPVRKRICEGFGQSITFPNTYNFEDLKQVISLISEDWFIAHSLFNTSHGVYTT